MIISLFLIGLFSGIVTGLLSIGGGIILIFSLMIIPPLLLNTQFSMHTIFSFSIMQGFFSSLSGGYYYISNQLVDKKIIFMLGIPAMFGGTIGVLFANQISDFNLRILFATLAIISAILMQIPTNKAEDPTPIPKNKKVWTVSIIFGVLIGILGGMVGLSAGFIFVPLMIFFYKLPIKMSIGTSLITCFLLSAGSLVSKLSMRDIDFGQVAVLIVGGIIGAQIGGRITKKLKSITLKRIAAYSILLVSCKLYYDLFV
ncbi:sulfite exporter TauE/SafE family protein [Bacillus sp. T33-2]|uniref:sulfite exporter TauE/SafE family protein n=1 Tax=Bacillus sp. T33-2 TaxID=2054168 RepID=UPI000C7953AB|nr:sulfite exporter TauE/SafE family protein [Bacillus sp. T33-2]PLR98500.1 sulfite exporter TauE/SafE family protein [Bacillus sp. T33-2]